MAVMGVQRQSIVFGGVNSADYDIYISGEGVFNAPERAVDLVTVPGRNGAIPVDQGHWNNIEVTYPAVYQGASLTSFTQNIRAFRNAIASKVGYQRLTDTLHPDEYRMGIFFGGLDIEPIKYAPTAEFDITFNCKPQRFLTAGESETTIAASGDAITNPTLFESEPLVVLDGYGKIDFNGYEMEVFNVPIGAVSISGSDSESEQIYASEVPSWTYSYNLASFENGDSITVNGLALGLVVVPQAGFSYLHQTSGSGYAGVTNRRPGGDKNGREWVFPAITFTVGTNGSASYSAVSEAAIDKFDQSLSYSKTINVTVTATHNAAAGTITFTVQSDFNVSAWNAANPDYPVTQQSAVCSFTSITGNSSASSISEPVYIDTEIGEAYVIHGGEPVSVNNSVSIGAELPRLAPGANTVTFDNTFDSVKIRPRWWQL